MARVNDTLLWRDVYISVFVDDDKYLIIFVNDKGHTKVVNYDDNFYSVEENIIAYSEMIKDCTEDVEEQEQFLRDFYDYTESEIKKCGEELNTEYLQYCGVCK